MKKSEIEAYAEKLNEHLMEANEIAELLREVFSSTEPEESQELLKEYCNLIRTKIYEIIIERGKFRRLLNQIQ